MIDGQLWLLEWIWYPLNDRNTQLQRKLTSLQCYIQDNPIHIGFKQENKSRLSVFCNDEYGGGSIVDKPLTTHGTLGSLLVGH